MAVVVETTVGDFTIDLYIKDRPRTCLNFLKLCKQHYYNFNLLFSIERNFVAQTGDPTGSGRGGDSIFKSMFGEQARLYEGEKLPLLRHSRLGTVSMATYGSHTFGSQFFITLGDELDSLDEEHLVFGHVSEGLDVIAKLNDVLTDEKNRPYQDIRVCHTVVLDDPFPDPENVVFPDESPRPTPEVLASDYIAVDESVEDTANKNISEIHEEIAAKEAEARATILEMVGDLPDVDTAPPENVLFVCKLNPVTTSEDLEVIFSRFGKINCAEVIKDRITGNSLQYAFIEFDETKSCEDAYFKMDNVLIDERRIHVDFSQSVSKIQWKGKGRGVVLYDEKGKKIPDKKDNNQFQLKTRDDSNKNDNAPKSRFIDTEAYSKRYKERQGAQHDRGMSHHNGERRFESRPRTHDDGRRQDRNRRPDSGNRETAQYDRDHGDRRHDTYNHRERDHRDTKRQDFDRDRRDKRRRDSPFDEYNQGDRRQDYTRDQRRPDFPRDNNEHRDRRDQNRRGGGESVEMATLKPKSDREELPDDSGARDGHQRQKMMAMLRSELGGGKAKNVASDDTSDSGSSSSTSREVRKKKKSKKKNKKRAASDSSESEDEKKRKKKRDSSSDSEDDRKKRKKQKTKRRDSDDNIHEHKKKKKKSKKRPDSSSDEHTKKKKKSNK